ncbi:Aste57867_789 [Aphanomyces stellatus]|uniref:Aste57867_789 protein n=1 Tax=Aphanomyces stellatus TaxID=120398 RepID=A0A485K8I9_9STRA|nr:hypothetical protein As57867_000788 [Aphanomyces stellatus]VFT78013.1 Aste57867_789 [Aphanomyces stellatus]
MSGGTAGLRHIKSFINGRHVAGVGTTRTLLDAHNRSPITQFQDVDRAQLAHAVATSAAAQPAWAGLSPAARGTILRRAASLIAQETKEFQHLECIDTGRVIAEMEGDILSATECLEYFAGVAPAVGGQMLDVHSPNWAYTRREPYGVTAGIGAWNYPLQSAVWKSAPSLAFGNSMVFKPSEETPLTAVRLAEVYAEAGVPPGVFNVVLGGGDVGAALVSDATVRKVSFTGSVGTGKRVYTACAEQLKPATMELGGKSALIIFDDTDVHEAVSGAMLANWYSNGQVCSNGTRVFVQRAIHDAFVDQLIARTAALRMGPPLDGNSQVGPMIHEAHLRKVQQYIAAGIEDGATLAYGGTVPPGRDGGNYILPAIFTHCRDDMRVVQEEVFGMVLCVLPFDDEADVVARANASPFGLSAGVFTTDLRRAHRVLHQLDVGTAWINTYNIAPVELPWGGAKQSGIGRENGLAGANAWTQLKSVYVEMDKVQCPYA